MRIALSVTRRSRLKRGGGVVSVTFIVVLVVIKVAEQPRLTNPLPLSTVRVRITNNIRPKHGNLVAPNAEAMVRLGRKEFKRQGWQR